MNLRYFVLIICLMSFLWGQQNPPYKNSHNRKNIVIPHQQLLSFKGTNTAQFKWKKSNTIGTALMLSCGVLAYYFNDQAESNYDRYLKTGSIEEMNNYYDKAQSYDKYKHICYIGVEIGFAINLWALIKED